jgi:hypothetical protein
MAESRTGSPDNPRQGETRDEERQRVRSSNDRDQERERQGDTPQHDRTYDKVVRGQQSRPTDPDSAHSDVDRDDTSDEP